MDYDVLIIGGGITGCAVAYELSKYSLNIALIEKDYDIADDVATINSAIVYDGVECRDTLMAKMEHMGKNMLEEITSKFNIPFKKCGSIFTAEDEEGENYIQELYLKAKERGIKDIEILDRNQIKELEPNINDKVKLAIYTKNTGIISPYDLAISYGEVAFDNGVNFRLEEEVLSIQKTTKGVKVTTNKNKLTCKMVVNTTPKDYFKLNKNNDEYEDKKGRKLNYLLLDESFYGSFNNVVYSIKNNGNNVYSYKTLNGQTLVAANTEYVTNYEETALKINSLLDGVDKNMVTGFYQTNFEEDTIIIDDNLINKGYLQILGRHYGQITMAPFIAKMICETITQNLNCILKKDYNDRRRDVFKFKNLSNEERNQIIAFDDRYGKLICLCSQITEGEIVNSIRRPLGARTLEGIKRRTGVTLGNCNGAYCMDKIISILARETNKSMTDIVKDSRKSKILVSRIKEFDEV